MHKFFTAADNTVNNTATILGDDVKHIYKVLRLDEGEEVPVRAIWPDGTSAKTLKVFDVHTVYDLSKGEFPALTLRPINLKACVDGPVFWADEVDLDDWI